MRFSDTIGLVVERVRPVDATGESPPSAPPHLPLTRPVPDRLRWYCKAPGAHATPTIIREEAFHCSDLGTQLKPLIQNWMNNAAVRKCPACGTVAEAK